MIQRHGSGLTALVWLGAVVTGCGGWVDLDSPKATGGSASGSTGAAGKSAAVGGAAGSGSEIIGRGQSGAPTGSPVDEGAGGDLLNAGGATADAGARLQVLLSPPPTLVPDGAGAPNVIWIGTPGITSGSLENGVLLGSNEYCFKAQGSGFNCDWSTREPFVWTEAAGMVVLNHLSDIPGVTDYYPQFVSDDGATVVGMFGTATSFGGYFRWTKTGGMARLGEPAGTASGMPEHMSNDGLTVSGMAKVSQSGGAKNDIGHQPFLWTIADGYRALAGFGTWPDGAELMGMSDDGSVLVGQTSDVPKQSFRWTPAGGVEQLGSLPGYSSCAVERISANAATIFGACQNWPDPETSFVWTEDAGIAPALQGTTPCKMYAYALSNDGATAFGTAVCGTQPRAAIRWSAAEGVVALPAPAAGHAVVSMNATNPAGNMTFGVLLPAGTDDFPEEGVDGAAPFRWSEAEGLVPLQSLPGHMFGYAYATDVAGEVLVGRSGNYNAQSEAVLWDSQGDIGIAAYLVSLGVNLQGARLQQAERVATRGGTIIVQGVADQQNHSGAWIAWLPQRD